MTPERRLTVLKAVMLAIEHPSGKLDPLKLACQYGHHADVTEVEAKDVLKDPLLTTLGKIQGIGVPLLNPKTLRLSGLLLSEFGGDPDSWDALADKIMCNLPRDQGMMYLYGLNIPIELAEKICTYVSWARSF